MDRVNPASGGNACDRIVPAATKRSLAKSGERSVSPAASFARKTRRAGGGCGKCGRSRRPARLSAARINAGTVRRFPVLLRARPLEPAPSTAPARLEVSREPSRATAGAALAHASIGKQPGGSNAGD
ncbi:unnamed protein product [Lampetra planeri]